MKKTLHTLRLLPALLSALLLAGCAVSFPPKADAQPAASKPAFNWQLYNSNTTALTQSTVTIGDGLLLTGTGRNFTLTATTTGAGGAPYTLPIASSGTLGGVKIGSGINVTSDGTISVATGTGGGASLTAGKGIEITGNVIAVGDPMFGQLERLNNYFQDGNIQYPLREVRFPGIYIQPNRLDTSPQCFIANAVFYPFGVGTLASGTQGVWSINKFATIVDNGAYTASSTTNKIIISGTQMVVSFFVTEMSGTFPASGPAPRLQFSAASGWGTSSDTLDVRLDPGTYTPNQALLPKGSVKWFFIIHSAPGMGGTHWYTSPLYNCSFGGGLPAAQ